MRIRYALIIFLLCLVHGTFAQNWQVADPYAFNDETVVYATLQSNVPDDPMTDFVVAAFIDGQCRVEAKAPVVGVDGSKFFVLRVRGDQTADMGKVISFRTYHKPMGKTYDLTPSRSVVYTGESEGTPSRPIILGLEREVGEIVPLQSFFLVYDDLAAGLATRIRLEPFPSNASFDAYGVQLAFTGSIEGWTAMQQQRVANDPLSFDLMPQYPGMVQVQATMNDAPIALLGETGGPIGSIEVGGLNDLNAGWQWRSNAYGDITDGNIFGIFSGNQLVEARTQYGLLYNDPTWGYFGTLMESGIPQNTCYKVKMGSKPAPTILHGGHYERAHSELLDGEWTWVGVPYYFDHPLSEALNPALMELPEGMVIVSKEDGSAEFSDGAWVGDLTVLRRGQGLMVYSPLDEPYTLTFAPEMSLPQGVYVLSRQEHVATSFWQYDASRFMNNTTIVAQVAEVTALSEEWTVGVFVGSECRGEGHYVEGCFFITAHTDRGEKIRLVLRHEPSGHTTDIVETLTTGQMRMGSLHQPVMLHAADATLGIRQVESAGLRTERYDLLGRKSPNARLAIVRMADGTVRKQLMK
ncbi:MAG: hypothetical protein IKQ05_04730 [Prevotella sp.]|nr:hypothetical protein [Prevotella sp.]